MIMMVDTQTLVGTPLCGVGALQIVSVSAACQACTLVPRRYCWTVLLVRQPAALPPAANPVAHVVPIRIWRSVTQVAPI